MSLCVVPIDLDEAAAFVRQHHRHFGDAAFKRARRKGRGHGKWALGAANGEGIVGVAIVGRPNARHLDDGWTAEVLRVATDGTKNACSFLYAASWRSARAHGYVRVVTYTLPEEGGASLRAAGWRVVGESKGGPWSRKERPRVDLHPLQRKLRWEVAVAS
jgi:hypothetical protein